MELKEVLTREVETEEANESSELFQSAFWARFKQRRGYPTQTFHVELPREHQNASLVVIQRPCGKSSFFGYVPYGPDLWVDEDAQGELLEEIAEKIRADLPPGCNFVRFDLPWSSPFTDRIDSDSDELPSDRIRELRMNFGSTYHNLRKSPIDMQPPDTVVIDLDSGARSILRTMKPKTRYNIRRAFRNNVSVCVGGGDYLDRWYELYARTTKRKGFVCEELSYFRRLFETASEGNIDLKIYLAWAGRDLLAGIIVARYAGTASYLFGASTEYRRTLMPSYALQWRAMMDAKRADCHRYDLFGIPPRDDPGHPMHGLYRFKTGFGGHILHLRGCWDYPFDPETYQSLVEAVSFANPYHQ